MEERDRKRYILEEQYDDDKRNIKSRITAINEMVDDFRRESRQVIEKYVYYMRGEEMNLHELEWKIREIENDLDNEANKEILKLEDEIRELNQKLEDSILALDKNP